MNRKYIESFSGLVATITTVNGDDVDCMWENMNNEVAQGVISG